MEEKDYRELLEKCAEAEKTSDTVHAQIRRRRYDGEEIWLDAKIRFLGNKGKRKMYYFYLMDITAIKKAEEEVYRNRYSKALFRVFDKVYRLDYDTGYAEVLHSVDGGFHAFIKKHTFIKKLAIVFHPAFSALFYILLMQTR